MVRLTDFPRIVYKRPRIFRNDRSLPKILGFDSEADREGRTFIFCTSLGDAIQPDLLIETLFNDTYTGSNFVTWNLKYESGAILKCFPYEVIKRLQLHHRTVHTHKGVTYEISYIPHKRLQIRVPGFRGRSVRFWDISPFYGRIKLEIASREYLGDHKLAQDTTLYTPEYIIANFDAIVRYCVKDAVLAQKLAALWISKFEQTGIPVTSLYSEASISYAYISRRTEIVTPWEYWDTNKKLVRYAFESYEGGKFEVISRGKFKGYEYDISSAYPYEIANLIDIREAHIEYGRRYRPDAAYGYLRVLARVRDPEVRLPFGIFKKLRVYPFGRYYLTITKQEYDYVVNELSGKKISLDILDGAWVIVPKIAYPYKDIMKELYALKQEWKKKDRFRSHNYKIIMNGFYGKMAQCIESEGEYLAGQGWNPLYSSVITANTRIAVTRLQNLLGRNCLAVHTDSAITTVPIPARFLGTDLGEFEKVVEGEGVIVACGIYEIAGQQALKGFKKHAITRVLRENPDRKTIEFMQKHVESWLQAAAQGHDESKINLFTDIPKILKLNCDTKRIWPNDMTSTEFLNGRQYSVPLLEHQKTPPEYWT